MLIVKGDRQVKVGNATESKQFNRELTLPEFVDAKTLQSYLSDDGQLTMEAPVLMDRVYQDSGSSAITSSSTFRQSSPGRVVDTTFTGGRPSSNFGLGNNQSNSYSSSSSSFRQESSSNSNQGTNSFHRNSPLRDQYSSTSSTSTIIGNQASPVTFSTITSRPEFSNSDRNDGTKNVTYKFNLSEFAPEDIAIQVNDTMLKVSALRQERDGRNTSHREFKREIGLPDGADAKKLTNTLSADGILTIQIPVRDYRPPLTPTHQSQHFNLPTNVGTNDSYSIGDQQLKLTFDLSGYKPDDVSVKVNDNVLKGIFI
jgi:HSP20 family molecular chaperone IbpA